MAAFALRHFPNFFNILNMPEWQEIPTCGQAKRLGLSVKPDGAVSPMTIEAPVLAAKRITAHTAITEIANSCAGLSRSSPLEILERRE
jgi:hypothetical protein